MTTAAPKYRFPDLNGREVPHLLLTATPEGETQATLTSGGATVIDPAHGPLMLSHPGIRSGRPVSAVDLLYAHTRGVPIEEDHRVVHIHRDWTVLPNWNNLDNFEIVCREKLHYEFKGLLRGRGRPSSFLQYDLPILISYRDLIWRGRMTQAELARECGVSRFAAQRFANAEILWWV